MKSSAVESISSLIKVLPWERATWPTPPDPRSMPRSWRILWPSALVQK